MNIPPPPSGWNKTIHDLMAEVKSGLRRTLGSPEVDWARDYERSLLPPGTRFPRQGDVYEAITDVSVNYLTWWTRPYTGGGEVRLRSGDKVVVSRTPIEKPVMVYADAVDRQAMEASIVPNEERSAEGYSGFYFAIRTADLNRCFRLVSSASE